MNENILSVSNVSLTLAVLFAVAVSGKAIGQEAVIHHEVVSNSYFQNCTGLPLPGYIWAGNPPIGLPCTGGLNKYLFQSYADQPVGASLRVCPNQAIPTGWIVANVSSEPSYCAAYQINGSYWYIKRVN